ncbi:MAG TPA: hypothetical protein DCQ06_03935 [Myxococcales bacterium]|nr:hypothetical protein [Myxococcales bacterium]HAN30724.1 hypothetical protein [Myxococcales bacterium]
MSKRKLPMRCRGAVFSVGVLALLTIGCGDDNASGSSSAPVATRAAQPEKAVNETPEAVDPPRPATAGQGLPALPSLPRRLDPNLKPGALPPARGCVELSPGDGFRLARKVIITRNGEPVSSQINVKVDQSDKSVWQPGTLELCVFHKWRNREEGENRTHSGRIHHFVAAFPGTDVAAWTSTELTRQPKTLPGDALWLSAGWASLIPTGLPDRPAIAVVSGRFYDGVRGEEIHYTRHARVLRLHKGRWAWVPWTNRSWMTLDMEHLKQACKSGGSGCKGLSRRLRVETKATARRLKTRKRRLDGLDEPKKQDPEGDPQSYWLALAQKRVKQLRWKEAIDLALRAEVVCGEPVRASRKVLRRAMRLGKVKADGLDAQPLAHPLCPPLLDKAPPKMRKVAKRKKG